MRDLRFSFARIIGLRSRHAPLAAMKGEKAATCYCAFIFNVVRFIIIQRQLRCKTSILYIILKQKRIKYKMGKQNNSSLLPGIGRSIEEGPLNGIVLGLGAISAASLGLAKYTGAYSVVGGVFLSIVGLAFAKAPRRTFPTAEEVSKGKDFSGKVAIITGPTSGIGTETARVLALRGAHVILAARNAKKNEAVKTKIEESLASRGIKAKVDCLQLDLNDLGSVESFAKAFLALKLPLHFLVNNAGVMALRDRRTTAQNVEQQTGINHIGHFRLAQLLLPTLKASAPSRVVALTSTAWRLAHPDFFDESNAKLDTIPYEKWVAYGNSKLSNMLFAKELHRRYASEGVTACSIMPGGIHTGLQTEVSAWMAFKWLVVTPFFFKSIEQGAATTIKACCEEDLTVKGGGAYWNDCTPTRVADKMSEKAATSLWNRTESLIRDLLSSSQSAQSRI